MTTSMIITLAVVILMIAVIISDKLPFGAPAILAAALLVVLGQADIATAFSGFVDKNVIMIMGFMIATAVLQKTEIIYKLKQWLAKVAETGGIKGFVLLIIAIMVVGNFITGTAFYVLVITLMAQIPYSKKLPTSRIVLPAAMATGATGWLPTGVALFAGIIASLCESAGVANATVSIGKICLISGIFSVIYLVYAVIAQRFLPDRDINNSVKKQTEDEKIEGKFESTLSKTQQNIVYVLYIAMLGVMIFLQQIPGEIGYAVPLIVSGVYLATGCIDFKGFLGNMFSPVLIMMAGVIGVAAVMANCGLSAFLGQQIAGLLGAGPSLLVLVLVFAFLTSIMATFTGASFGSLFVFAPIGIALCVQYGYNPVPLAYACTMAAWINFFMPIDGMPAMTMGMGKYKLMEFWAFTIPLWIIKMVTICVLGTILL
ncbi:MAG: membrane transport protein [Erysipelotrichia bacterium]|nr:membrane transport protein [Erysipelotrichia bacterium]